MGKLNNGFLISYDWLPALESLSGEDYKALLSALIKRQKDGVPLPKFDNELVNIFAQMIEPQIKRRLCGQTGGNKAKKDTTVDTTVDTAIAIAKLNKAKLNKANTPPTPSRGKCAGFEEFWLAYPKKKDKQNAIKAWNKLKPDAELVKSIIEALTRAKSSEDWQKDGGQYIPLPSTYINGRRWEDEIREVNNAVNRNAAYAGRDNGENYGETI